MKRILSILLENESGALSRVIGLFSQRGYNIDSLTVAPTEDPTLSKMTIQTHGDQKIIEQIEKQLHKLIDVFRVSEMKKGQYIEREILLITINIKENEKKFDITQLIKLYHGDIIHITAHTYTIQIFGTSNIIDNFLYIIKQLFKVIETVRSGVISISKEFYKKKHETIND
ncbi:acetolactate synthase III, small subunit [Buchnera aphidicola (Cinara tujafilina)]|uniref:Acetolactate synthase small subunit n=1 Tax=Buchnera aphidicola (Cinara tujafilina) TaxID=261317 RepID=F7WZ77_9GAMM|nr:acetolactate synthase small subunit [Buchnera aphidicola]AEH39731.1 acetolactate synthase III, small subunit [Buchnera aphidicola (Cinara tujafilina)]